MPTENIKKVFLPIFAILEGHQEHKVKSIMTELLAEMSKASTSPSNGAHCIFGEDGAVLAVKDNYFQRWMPLVGDDAVEFTPRATAISGVNSVCKVGAAQMSRQNTIARKALANLLVDLESGKLAIEDIADAKVDIAYAKDLVTPTSLGFETKEEVEEYLANL